MGLFDSVGQVLQNPLGNIGRTAGTISGGILGGPIGAVLGNQAFDAIGGSGAPAYQQLEPSEQLQNQLSQHTQRAAQTPEQYKQQYLEGVSGAAGDLGFDPMSEALSGRSRRIFQKSSGDLNRQAEFQGIKTAQQRMGRSIDLSQAMENYRRGIDSKAQELAIQAEATRSQVLGQMLGGLGSAVGGIAGSQGAKNTYSPSPAWASAPPIGTFQGSGPGMTYNSQYFGTIGGN